MGPPLTEIVLTLTQTIIFIDLLITSLIIASVSSSGLDVRFTDVFVHWFSSIPQFKDWYYSCCLLVFDSKNA